MANTQAMCTSFKADVLAARHAFAAPPSSRGVADSFKAALYLATATMNAGTTVYTVTDEVSGSGYTAGGEAIAGWEAPTTSGTTGFTTPSANITWTSVTLATAFDAVLIYNNTHATKYAVSVHTFGSQTVTAGNFTLSMPVNDASNALIRFA